MRRKASFTQPTDHNVAIRKLSCIEPLVLAGRTQVEYEIRIENECGRLEGTVPMIDDGRLLVCPISASPM